MSFIPTVLNFADTALSLVPKREGLSSSSQYVFNQVRGRQMLNIRIFRTPLAKSVGTALSTLSVGQWQRFMAQRGYDKTFHLGIYFEINDDFGRRQGVVAEKNDVVEVRLKSIDSFEYNTQMLIVPRPTQGMTFDKMYNASLAKMGAGRFYSYNFRDNNCQVWVENMLGNVGMLSEEARRFVMQPVDDIAAKALVPWAEGAIHWATDRAARFRSLTGRGLDE